MIEPVLFMTTGAAVYGSVHHFYRGISNPAGQPHRLHGLMFLLLAGFALSGTSANRVHSLAEFSWYGKISVSLGMMLFAALPWFIAQLLRQPARLLPTLFSVIWSALLLANIASPYSLLYQGQPSPVFQGTANPAWHLVEIAMLSTLFYSMYLCVKQFRSTGKAAPIAPAAGLLLLLITTIFDFFVYAGLIHFAYLAPMGFLLFLIVAAADQQAPEEAGRYQITLNLDHLPGQNPQTEITRLVHQHTETPVTPSVRIDNPAVDRISDSLVDIAVDATLMLKRLEHDTIDAAELRALGRNVRTRAIDARRITRRLLRTQYFKNQSTSD